jgi:hypothetical protein
MQCEHNRPCNTEIRITWPKVAELVPVPDMTLADARLRTGEAGAGAEFARSGRANNSAILVVYFF